MRDTPMGGEIKALLRGIGIECRRGCANNDGTPFSYFFAEDITPLHQNSLVFSMQGCCMDEEGEVSPPLIILGFAIPFQALVAI